MGNLFSKKRTQVAPERISHSAPAGTGALEGTRPESSRPNSAPTDPVVVTDVAALKAVRTFWGTRNRLQMKGPG